MKSIPQKINEEQGVSQEVIEQTNQIIEAINKQLPYAFYYNFPYNYIDDNGVTNIRTQHAASLTIQTICGIEYISVDIYFFDNKEEANRLFYALNFDCAYNFADNTMKIRTCTINGEFDYPSLRRMVSHELMHHYQYQLKQNFNIKIIYNDALHILDTTDYKSFPYMIAYTIYWLDKNEVNANTQALYAEIKEKKLKTLEEIKEKSNLYKEFVIIKKYFDMINNGELDECYNSDVKSNLHNLSIKKLKTLLNIEWRYAEKNIFRAINLHLQGQKTNESINFPKSKYLKAIFL